MRTRKQFFKRAAALLMSLLMLFTSVNVMGVIAESPSSHTHNHANENLWTGTTGSLIADNYAELNEYEKAILGCTALVGDTYAVEMPTNSTGGLVSVDATAQTVTAKSYTVDGFVWTPTAAVIKYTNADGSAGTDVEVTLTKVGENYVGNFSKPANSYRVEVTYSLYIEVDEAIQELLLNTPYYLVDGYVKLNDAADGSLAMAVSAINERMEELRLINKGIKYEAEFEGEVVYTYTLGFANDSACKVAISNLIADYDANGGSLTLSENFKAYMAAPSKIKFMLENGEEIKENIKWFYTQLANINANSQELLDIADKLDNLATGTGAGTIADAKNTIDSLVAEAQQLLESKIQSEIIEPAIKMAKDDFGIDISSLRGKTRANNAIYNEIAAKRTEFNTMANDLDALADFYAALGNTSKEAEYRDMANEVRTTGIEALDKLESGIREAYSAGDAKIAELSAKKADLDDIAVTATQKADDVRGIVNGANGGISLRQVVNTVRGYNNQKWDYIGKKLVKDSVTDAEYAELDAAVKGALDPVYGDMLVEDRSDLSIKNPLLATTTVVTAMVDQYVVYVDVKAEVVLKSAENTAALTTLAVSGTSIPLNKGSDADSIVSAITASGIENAALSQWDSYYNINTANYNRVVTLKDSHGHEVSTLGELNGDIYYTITYTPKTLTITEEYNPAGSQVTEVPYGYNWRLPRPLELSKSYDYVVNGSSMRENTVIRVVENLTVNRTEGKAVSAKTLSELIAMSNTPGSMLSAKEKEILKSNAFKVDTVYFRTPESSDKLTKVEVSGAGYLLTAKPMSAGLVGSNAEWIPVSACPVTATGTGSNFNLSKNGDVYEGYFTFTGEFTSVNVIYELSIDGISASTINEIANLADLLVNDVAAQKATLNSLCNENNFHANLGRVTSTILGSVGSVVTDITPAAKAALNALTSQCINPETGYTYLYEYLTQYKSEDGGMAYYYKGDNAAKISNQINLVNQYLPLVWNDAPVQAYINSMPAISGEADKIEAVMDQLKSVDLKPINSLVDTNSAYINNLLAAIESNGTTAAHTGVGDTVVLRQNVSAVAPGLTEYAVEIQVLNKNDGLVQNFKSEAFRAQGEVVTVAEFTALYNALLATIPNNEYYVITKVLPTANVTLGADAVSFVSAMRPKTYTVRIDGEADQILYAFDAYTVTLPGTGLPGMKYVYDIAGKKVEVGSGALENFALATSIDGIEAVFGGRSVLNVTRKLVDTNKENLIAFINKFNNAFANSGLTFGNNLAAAFIPMEDANGNLSVVFRLTSNFSELEPMSLASEMATLIEDISYVGINGNPLFGLNSESELKLYIQTIINMLVNSNMGFANIVNMIDDNGNIKEMKLRGMNAVGANGGNIILDSGKVINDVDALGGKVAEATMQYGININNATSVPFYITYQDFDTQRDLLKKAKKGAEQIIPYADIELSNGAVNFTVNLPDSVYAYLMTAYMIAGQIDFSNITSYDFASILKYNVSLINPLFEREGVTADSFVNTIGRTGLYDAIEDFDIEAHRAFVELIYDSVDHLYDNIAVEGSSEGGVFTGVYSYDALDTLANKKVVLDDYSSMIAELETGLTLPVVYNLKNRDVEYEALILDVRADGITNKYKMSRKAAASIPEAKDEAIVVLLSDVRGDIVFNNDVILNLNGHTVNGDLIAKGSVTIVDSTLVTRKCGSVTGDLIADGGSFKLTAGKYMSGAEAYLAEGYVLNSNVVSNGCYTIEQKGKDLNVYLSSEYLSLDRSAAKGVAVDLLSKLLMNYYGCSELIINGNELYGVDLIDITDSLDQPTILINKIIDCINCAGSSAFATEFIATITDFEALATAIDTDSVVASYTIQNSAFNPFMAFIGEGEDSYFTFNVSSADNKQIRKFNILVDNNVPVEKKEKMSAILRELDSILNIDTLAVDLKDISFNRGSGFLGLIVEGTAAADITLDLTNNINYPIIMTAILAADASGAKRAELIDAIKNYQETGSTAGLKAALDAMSTSQLISALESTRSMSFAGIAASIGINAPEAVELENLYTIVRKVIGATLARIDVEGGSSTLAGLAISGEYGTYGAGIKKSADTYAYMTLKLFVEDMDIVVKDKNGITYFSTNDLEAALGIATAGSSIYVNGAVVLENDVLLPAVSFSIVRAENIDFNGKTLWIDNANTIVTSDKDISDYIDFDRTAIICSEIQETEIGGKFQYQLIGEQHEWETIPGVDADCTNDGVTESVSCKHCHVYQDGKAPQVIPALGHNYIAVVTAPTCTEDGYTTYTCDRCGDTYVDDYVAATNHQGTSDILPAKDPTCTESGLGEGLYCSACDTVLVPQKFIPALGHTEEILPGKAATCTEDGLTEGKKCSVCDEIIVAQVVIKASHTPASLDKDPTCTEDGLTGNTYCTVCGEELAAGTVIPAAHKPETIPGKAASCTATGLTDGQKCSVCGEILVEQTVIPMVAHTHATEAGKAPTCTEDGLTDKIYCSVCNTVLKDAEVIAKLGHTEVIIPAKAATCTEDGLTEGKKCAVCGEITVAQKPVKASGHSEETIPAKAATCTETGLTEGKKCSVCGEILAAQAFVPMKAHTQATEAGKAPTCTEDGLTDKVYCSVCNTVIKAAEVIAKLGHTEVVIPAKAATCTEDGLTEGKKCAVCGEITVAQKPIKASGHSEETIPGKAATCTEDGLTEGKKCSVCGEITVAQKVIPTLEHTLATVAGKAPTCSETGLTDKVYCSVCNTVFSAHQEIPALNHAPVTVPGKAATCTEDGLTEGVKCAVCDEVIVAQDVISAHHTPVDYEKAPTCSESGIANATVCSVCGESLSGTVVPALGHTLETIAGKDATCSESGLTEGKKCSVCGEIVVPQFIIPAVPHKHVTLPGKAATCVSNGYTSGISCSVCGITIKVQEIIPAIAHKEVTLKGYAATCTSTGLTDGKKCSVCGEITVAQEIIPMISHKEVTLKGYAATCTSTGLTDGKKCSVCGKITVAQEIIPMVAHTEETLAGKAATCTSTGLTEGKKCSVCGKITVAQEIIPMISHKEVTLKGYAATCTSTGLTDGKKCSVCGKITVAQEIIPIVAHKEVSLAGKDATCDETGLTEGKKCSVCGKITVAQEIIPMLGHTHAVETGKAPTCTETGLTDKIYCSVCGTVIKEAEEIAKLGHIEVTLVGKDATCTENGLTEGKKCSVCGEITVAQEVIPMLGHTEETLAGKDATCDETGLTEGKKCSVCGEITVAQEIIPTLAHTEVTLVGKDATCTENGLTEGKKCSVCDEIIVAQEIIFAKGHTVEIIDGKAATCTENGLTAGAYCPVCDHVHVAQQIIDALGHDIVVDSGKAATCTSTGLTEGSHCARCGEVIVAQQLIPIADHSIVVDPAKAPTAESTGLTEGSHCSACGKVVVAQKVLAKLPYIHVPTVKVEATDGIIRGAKVDATDKYIFLDVNPDGFTVSQFVDVYFKIDNATTSKQTLANFNGSAVRGANDLVCTGDTVTVWAANEDGAETSVTYHIIIMGDANCDGKLNARDVALMKLAFVGDLALEGPGALAADMNFDGKLNARDTVACETKYVLWSENEYVSQTK